jgi:rod shape-determining protein MreC
MIGRIFLAGDHTSWVILLTDLNSRIPVAVQPGNIQAMLAGDNTAAPPLESSAQSAQLKNGDQIVTSGDGALLPAGLPIGVVYWDGAMFRGALFADASMTEDVRILDLKTPAEQPPAPSPGDLPVSAAGLAPLAPPRTAALPIVNGNPTPQPRPQTETQDLLSKPVPPDSPNDQGDNQ